MPLLLFSWHREATIVVSNESLSWCVVAVWSEETLLLINKTNERIKIMLAWSAVALIVAIAIASDQKRHTLLPKMVWRPNELRVASVVHYKQPVQHTKFKKKIGRKVNLMSGSRSTL